MDAELFYILVGSVVVAAIARWRGWPAPLLVTVAALAVSFLPFVPDLEIDGHVLLNLALPPLLYSAALDVSFVGFKRSLPQIQRLGIWLVLLTTAVVGVIAWLILPSLTLPGALLLGAIVAPPDAVSAAAIGRKLGLPRRIMNVLSGESLINDATSLTLYRVFALILAGATVTIWEGIWQFVLAVVVGIAIGLVFGVVLHQLRMRVGDAVVIGTFGLLAPFGAYAIAEHLGGSGVLAVVAMGIYVGFNSPRTDYTTRQQEKPLWLSADLLLESFVFAYIGLQFPRVLRDLGAESVAHILWLSAAVLLAVLIVRPLFVFPATAWANRVDRRRLARVDRGIESGEFAKRAQDSPRWSKYSPEELRSHIVRDQMAGLQLNWRDNAVISWAGMRGVVTLATALAAADLATLGPEPSHAIVVVAFIVTVGTLLLQGLTLPLLITRLGIRNDAEHQEDAAALAAVQQKTREAGKAFLAAKRVEWESAHGELDLSVFDSFAKRMSQVEKATDEVQQVAESVARPSFEGLTALSRGWLQVRREIVVAERDAGNLDEEVMRELMSAMDAEELALDTRGAMRHER
ncbi:cation:proton antiporter [Microbacterium sp.]|uniref:cation:proton antiporter n=1 Tax=Microbacterium sp. TaxID=51671 RepID=UPI0039E6ABA2